MVLVLCTAPRCSRLHLKHAHKYYTLLYTFRTAPKQSTQLYNHLHYILALHNTALHYSIKLATMLNQSNLGSSGQTLTTNVSMTVTL